MSPVVVGQNFKLSHPSGQGHWWSAETLYLHSLLHDPFILSRIRHLPTVITENQIQPGEFPVLVICAQPFTPADSPAKIQRVLDGGGAVVLNQPDAALLGSLPSLNWATANTENIPSLRERWDLNSPNTYYYADRQYYGRHDPTRGQVLSWIGDHPDLIVQGKTALFAGNPWPSILGYLNAPNFSRLLVDFANVLVRMVALLMNNAVCDGEAEQMREHPELRRDFHAFGFAAFTVEQLELSLGVSRVNLHEARAAAVQAAVELASGNAATSQSTLRNAFCLLERENRKLQPVPAIFTDTLHGGGLFGDMGFCEFDWPQHAADVLANHLDWIETRGYRLNIDFAVKSLKHLAERFPRLFARLLAAQQRGGLEMVNGTWNQPYPPFFTLESIIRQFDLGGDALQNIMGRRSVSFASQEFSFAPQLASVLSQHGYKGVVLRAQNMGDAPVIDANMVRWTAVNGDGINALPSHAYKSEHLNEVTYNNLHLKLFAAGVDRPTPHVFTGLGDITYYRPFREELARMFFYAPVFGTFATWREYFSAQGTTPASELRTTMEDFDCRASFLEVSRWQHLRWTGGGSVAHCMRSAASSELFRAAEILELLTPPSDAAGSLTHDDHWRALATFQGHDRYFSPGWPVGGFMTSAFNPTRQTGRIEQTVADYCGPVDTTTIGQRAGRDLQIAEKCTRRWIRDRLRTTGCERGALPAWAIYNPGPARRAVMRFRGIAGRSLLVSGQAVACEDNGKDLLAAINLPGHALMTAVASKRDSASPHRVQNPVRCGDDYLDNGLLRVEFNRKDGTITRILRATDGRPLLVDSHRFTIPGSREQQCKSIHWRMRGRLKATVEFTLEVITPEKSSCEILATLSLEADQSLLCLRHQIITCPAILGDQWENHLGVQFNLPEEHFGLKRSHYNVMENSQANRIFSPNLLLAEFKDDAQVLWVNCGNQFYVRDGRSVTAMLRCENETAHTFSHHVGWSRDNPLTVARALLTPLFRYRLQADPPKTTEWDSPRAIALGCGTVELLSLRKKGSCLQARLASLTDKPSSARLSLPVVVSEAWLTDLTGRQLKQLETQDGIVKVNLRPWDIAQLELRPAHGAISNIESP